MSRSNRRHTRQIERHRHNKGPELLCRAADNELQEKAGQMVQSLSKATIEAGDVAAAGLLVTLAENACYEERAPEGQPVFSMAERWAREPQVVELDHAARLESPRGPRLELTDGRKAEPAGDGDGEIVDAEFQMIGEGQAGG